jgi:hypothetical protein
MTAKEYWPIFIVYKAVKEGKRMPRGSHHSSKTHCVNGHEFTPENTRVAKTGRGTKCRQCKACHAKRSRAKKYDSSHRTKRWRAKNREHYRTVRAARDAVRYALRTGRLQKPKECQGCGISGQRLEGHHFNGYTHENRLMVWWLCPLCHARLEDTKES